MARQARQICRGTRRLNPGGGAVLRHRPGRLGKGIITELIFAPGQRPKCGRALVSQESGAHTGNDVELLQTPAARETADKRVKLSAEASHAVTGIRSGALAMSGSQPAPVAPAGENAPAEVVLARIQAERDASQRGQQRISRQEPIKKPRWRRIRRSASPLFRGVTTPDLPEGI